MPIYKVSVEIEALVYAHSEDDARKFSGGALRMEHDSLGRICDSVRTWDGIFPPEWGEETVLYASRYYGLTVAEARKLP